MTDAEILSPAVVALLEIMTSTNVQEAKCIEAARAIIEYEAPPGVFDLTHRYLLGIAQDAEQDVGLKLEALKLLRKVEARRVVPGAAADAEKTARLAERVEAARKRVARFRDGGRPVALVRQDDPST